MGEACRGERCDRDGETKIFGYRRREERSVKLRAIATALEFATEFFYIVTLLLLESTIGLHTSMFLYHIEYISMVT